ncbi:amino acid ABC transporter permease [Chromatiales bacterium (ex Bugula neritina AB1)]|nr:amino acid ABC transporter permease [Chromatiales bacterium (ex Bugula neritina AB1)]
MKFDFNYTLDALPRLFEGSLVTLKVALLGFALSVVLATLVTVARTTLNSRVLNVSVAVYISFIRGTPLLVQIFLVYYVLPVFGLNIGPVTAGVLALTLNSAAFVIEILRGGLASVPEGQTEAARSLGISGVALWGKVILPQAFISSVPPLVNEFTQVLKATALLSTITVVELMRVSQQIYSSNYHPIEVLLGAFVMYFLMCFVVSRNSSLLEAKFAIRRA